MPTPGCRKAGWTVEAGGGGFVIEADRWDRLVVISAQLRNSAVKLRIKREACAAERNDGTAAGDGFREAECRLSRGKRVRSQAIEVDAIKRVGLGIQIEQRRDMEERCLLLAWAFDDHDVAAAKAEGLDVGAGAPGLVGGGDGVGVEREAPLIGEILVLDKGEAGGEAVLGSEAATAMCKGLAGEQRLGDVGEVTEGECIAGLGFLFGKGCSSSHSRRKSE